MFMIAGILVWVFIVLLFVDVGWKGRVAIAGIVLLSMALPRFGDADSAPLLGAIGFSVRVLLAIFYIARERLGTGF